MRIFKLTLAAMLALAVVLTSCRKDEPGGDSHTPIKMVLADSCHIKVDGVINSKQYFTFNAYGLPVETRRVKAEGNGFVNDSLVKRGFDKHRNMLFEERYVWKNGFWNTASKREYTYNSNDSIATYIAYNGNGDVSGWRATEKHEYDYDKSGVKTKHNAYTAVSGDILKLKSSLTSAVDPETGLCTFATEYIYDDNGVKTPVTRTEYTRYDDGNVKVAGVDKREGDVWKSFCISTFTYDAGGRKTLEMGAIYNTDKGVYDMDEMIGISYTTDGKLTMYKRDCKFDDESSLSTEKLVENEYNASGKIVKYHLETKDGKFRGKLNAHLIKSADCAYKYDNAGNLIEETFNYDFLFKLWPEKGVIEYFNSEHVF